MDYRGHIESHSGMTMSLNSVPSLDDVTNYLIQGAIEVISNVLKFNPGAGLLFSSESDEQEENGFKLKSGILYNVVREDGTDNQWRPCRQVEFDKEYLVTDTDSMFFASKYNPVFIRDGDNNIRVYPTPSSSNEAYKINFIEYPKYDNDGFDLTFATDIDGVGIKNFPETFLPHLIKYGTIKSMTKYYHSVLINDEDVELGDAYLKTIDKLDKEYINMFITKDVLTGGQQRQEQVPQERRG